MLASVEPKRRRWRLWSIAISDCTRRGSHASASPASVHRCIVPICTQMCTPVDRSRIFRAPNECRDPRTLTKRVSSTS